MIRSLPRPIGATLADQYLHPWVSSPRMMWWPFPATFGQEAGEDLVNWMQGVDTQRWEFRELHEATTARFESRLGESTAQLRQEISELRLEMRVGFARLETTLEQRHASLMRWSFVFWIGSVAAIAAAVAAPDQFLHH